MNCSQRHEARMLGRMRFSLGINYWPRRSAMAMWRRFDAGEIREDFARIAGLGLDTVRFFLRWDDFAPAADAIDAAMLTRLEAVAGAKSSQRRKNRTVSRPSPA